jgi:PAS domain S-box-containing protein
MELGSVEHFEFRAGRKDGTTIIVSANAKIVYNSEGEPMWVEGNIRDTSEIKEVSNALSESENRFRATFEQAAIGIAHVSTEGRFLRINEKFCDIIGYSHDEMLGLTFQDITHPEDLGNDLKDVQGVINGEKESFSKEKRYIRKSGEIMWGHLTVSIVRNNIGESQWFVAVVKDINEQKLAEMALRQNRDLLKHLVSAMPDAVFHIKMPVRTINWTDDSFDVMGYEPEEYIGQSTEKYYANPEDYTKVGRLQQEAISRGDDMISTEIMARRKDGKVFPAELTATFYKEEGKISQITAFVRDISKRKQAEEKLLESEEKFKTLVTKTEEIIFIIAKDGTFLLSEGKGLDKLGLKPGEVVGISVFDLYKDFPTLLDKIRQAFSGETVIMEHEVGDFYFKSWYTPHLNQNGEIIGLLGLAVNITEQKIAENKIMGYQNRLKALANELILSEEKQRRQIATDLHDHVGQILASSRLQIAALNNSMEKEDILKKLKSISGGINDTIKATQDAIFELSPPQLNQIGLAAALSDWMHKELKTKHGIKCELLGDAKKYPVNNVMRYLLFRCACELLVNVVKHARASKVKVNVQNKNDNITVSVQDNGSGFNYNPKLHKMEHSGFGLLSIYERIENIGGTLQIDTAPGKGTKVVLKVPVNN